MIWYGAREVLKALEGKIQNPILLREIQNAQVLFSIHANDISASGMVGKNNFCEDQMILRLQKEREALTWVRLQIAEGKTDEAKAY